jgi:hypothetical protein
MGAEKITQFYDDRIKQAADTRAARLADYRRSLAVDTRLRWEAHRRQVLLRRRVLGWMAERGAIWSAVLRSQRSEKASPAGNLISRS